MTSPVYLTAIWPGNDGATHCETIEHHFGIKLRSGESSYYASVIYRWRPRNGGWRWFRSAEPDGIAAIQLYQNCEGHEDLPIINDKSMDDWVVEIVVSGAAAAIRDFLAAHGTLIDK